MAQFVDHHIEIQISNIFNIVNDEIDKGATRCMYALAEKIAAEVKAQPEEASWFNQTGNLRSSVRAATLKKGKLVIKEHFEKLLPTAEAAEERSDAAIAEIAAECKGDYHSIIVAAMEYAGYVEAMENKQVLAGVWARYRQQIPRILQEGFNAVVANINRRLGT